MKNNQPSSTEKEKSGLLRRGGNKLLKALKITTAVGAAVSIILTIQYKRTRYDVALEWDTSGAIRYVHEDEKTTHIINYLSGKEELAEEEIMNCFRSCLVSICDKEDIYIDVSKVSNMNIQQLDEYFTQVHDGTSEGDIADFFILQFNKRYARFSRQNYDNLWKMMQEVGNPKIRFSTEYALFQDGFVACYNPVTNTMHLPMPLGYSSGPVGSIYAEAGHAQQFDEAPIYWSLRALTEIGGAGVDLLRAHLSAPPKSQTSTSLPTARTQTKSIISYFCTGNGLTIRRNIRNPFFETTGTRDGWYSILYDADTFESDAHGPRQKSLEKNLPWEYPGEAQYAEN